MPTKAELEDQVKTLKGKLRDLAKELKESVAVKGDGLGDNPYTALGLFKDNGAYKFARVQYNPETKVAEIMSITDASRVPSSADLAKFNFEETVQEEIFSRVEKKDV